MQQVLTLDAVLWQCEFHAGGAAGFHKGFRVNLVNQLTSAVSMFVGFVHRFSARHSINYQNPSNLLERKWGKERQMATAH